ncbi:MAG TPA: FkbM family methyltransferase [Bacteroidia bacterium]|jgi:FkbM family methyltransferase|nr:FkbM family methyltransferase [Bacteroidia bacterium]
MKNIIKKIINVFIAGLTYPINDKIKIAAIYSFFSKLLYSKDNTLEFDAKNNIYWCKHKDLYLYSEREPTFKFSLEKLYKTANRICCRAYVPKLDDIVIDVGAGVGTETVFFVQKIGDNGKLFNFEASPSTYSKLKLLSEKNKMKVCKNINMAISAKEDKIWIEEQEEHQKAQINPNKKGTEVKAISLDSFIKEEGLTKINFIKVNIEGAEYDMIDGMKETISITENIAISCHDFLFENKSKIKDKVINFLRENNFEISENNTGHQVVDSWIYGKKYK